MERLFRLDPGRGGVRNANWGGLEKVHGSVADWISRSYSQPQALHLIAYRGHEEAAKALLRLGPSLGTGPFPVRFC